MGSILARLYDPVTSPLERTVLEGPRRRAFSDLPGRVLDLGTGTGGCLPHLRSARQVVALDPDPFLLARAVAKHRRPGTHFVRGDGASLPFRSGAFDGVAVGLVLCTIPELEAALGEVRRVLGPGGTLAFVEHVRLDGPAGRVQDLAAPLWRRATGGCRLNRDTMAVLGRSGFRLARVEERLGGLLVWGSALVDARTPGTMASQA